MRKLIDWNASATSWLPTRVMALKISLCYALLGSLWILCSGWLLHRMVQDEALQAVLENVKGWCFVWVTALLLWLALDRYFQAIRKATQLLQDSEKRWEFALGGAGHGVWDWNPQTDEVFYSPAWKSMLGYGPDDIPNTSETWKSRVHPEDLPRVTGEIRRYLAGESPAYISEYRMLAKDCNYIWILDQGKIMSRNSEGRPVRLIGTHLDITERKRNEEEKARLESHLQQAQKMESIGRLAGGVAHDFNNMLGAILGYAELALEQTDSKQPVYSDLKEIQKAANRSADLTRQLLAFARRQTVVPTVLNLNQIVDGIFKMLQRLIGENLNLKWSPGEDIWQIEMDPSQVDQILTNLCINARDAITGVGTITIATGNRMHDEEYCLHHPNFLAGEYVLLSVSDTGHGMDSEIMERIFEPFFTTKAIGEGTGLGLATIYGIVRQNNGFLNVDSAPGRGTTFEIYLPRYTGKTAGIQSRAAWDELACGQETILLVEDEPSILKMTKRMLEQQGYTVLAASTPARAIRLAGEYPGDIHMLITDVVMPEMTGTELAKNLSSAYPRLKRLFMSGYPSVSGGSASSASSTVELEPGAHFLQKPFSKDKLLAVVRKCVDAE